MEELLTEDGKQKQFERVAFLFFQSKKEILMGIKQAQAYLNNLSIQGQTKTGQTQHLKTQVIDHDKKIWKNFF